MSSVWFFISVLFLISCQTVPPLRYSQKAYKVQIDTWIGVNKREVIKRMGYPDAERKSPDGNLVFEYVSKRAVSSPASVNSSSNTVNGATFTTSTVSGGETAVYECKTWFEFQSDKIVSTNFRGNDCIAPEKRMGCEVGGKFVDYGAQSKTGEWLCNGKPGVFEYDDLYLRSKDKT